jgi:hypothetical protein
MSTDLLALITDQPFAPEPETATTADGWVYRLDTGECVGCLDDDRFLVRERFEVDSPESADWVLRKRQEVDSEIARLTIQFDAIKRQFDARLKTQHQRLAYLDWRFASRLIAWARSQLTRGSRTWRGTYGSVKFRKTQGTRKVLDDAAAVEFVETYAPELVKVTKSVNLKAIDEARQRAAEALGEGIDLPFVACAPPDESVTITTGIEV